MNLYQNYQMVSVCMNKIMSNLLKENHNTFKEFNYYFIYNIYHLFLANYFNKLLSKLKYFLTRVCGFINIFS